MSTLYCGPCEERASAIKAVVVLGGELTEPAFYRRLIEEHDYVIAADRGGDHLRSLGIVPDVVVGDFDSITKEAFDWLRQSQAEIKSYPADKEKTDGELALEAAISAGASEVTMTCAWGGRLDHTVGNLFLLQLAKEACVSCRLVEPCSEITLIDQDSEIIGRPGETISIIPLERCEGLSLRGFKYVAEGITLERGSTRGLSNELINDRGKIMIETGQVLIIREGLRRK